MLLVSWMCKLFCFFFIFLFFFFKQKTAYEILTCDWSSDVCSSDLVLEFLHEDVLRNDVTAFNCKLSFRYNYGFYTQGQTMGLVPCTTNFSLIQMYYFTGILLFIITLFENMD